MHSDARRRALEAIASGAPSPVARNYDARSLPDFFGERVFNDSVQRRRLPKPTYKALRRTLESGAELAPDVADAIAGVMKDWAIEQGATHYTHWFQPMHGLTAEKHDAFLSPTLEGGAIQEFSGKELILGEPDASSLPSGGVRNTFEARGYTGWDPGSPAFLRQSEFGKTLTIPTVFVSWTGDALDTKTPLLRSCEALDRQARRVLGLLGDSRAQRVETTVGPEQEYFLVDRHLFHLRPDLVHCERTVLGARPPKGQELEDHYFSQTPRRILDFMKDLEHELWSLGVPVKTRHGEVAPHQFETAPVFESAPVSVDHNMLTMEVLQDVADRHGMVALLHEKPFAGVNGSGKHCNWSMSTDQGDNLLSPGHTPAENQRFMVFLAAIIRAVDKYQALLRASIARSGNDHRLGANEAPPAILSIYLGDDLHSVVERIIEGKEDATAPRRDPLRLGVASLPELPIHSSDRNRTSPFAFTGSKFEFRAVGSSQSCAFPVMVINTIVAESLDYVANRIEAELEGGNTEAVVAGVTKDILAEHRRILFSGDNYGEEWRAEASRRGLVDLPDAPTALGQLDSKEHCDLFATYGVLTERETHSRAEILLQSYVHRLWVESATQVELARTAVLPAASEHQRRSAEAIRNTREVLPEAVVSRQESALGRVTTLLGELAEATETQDSLTASLPERQDDLRAAAYFVRSELVPAMDRARAAADALETVVGDDLWPLPKYRELLYAH